MLAAPQARGFRAIEDPLHRRSHAGGEGNVEHAAVVHHVQVHDRRAAQLLHPLADGALGQQPRRPHVRHCQHGRVGLQRAGVAVHGHTAGGPWREIAGTGAGAHLHAGVAERALGGVAVQVGERHACVAHVARVGARQQPGLEDHRGERKRGLSGGQVERGQGDQVPEGVHRRRTLAPLLEPVAEAHVVECPVLEIEAREGERHAHGAQPLGGRQEGVGGKRGRQMQGGLQAVAAELPTGAVRGQHRDREPLLQHRVALHAEPAQQRPVVGAAAQEDVLAVVHLEVAALERVGGAAEPRAHLQQRDPHAGICQVEGGRDAGQAAAHHDRGAAAHAAASIRLRAATQAFSQPGKDTRSRTTSSGDSSIRSSRRR